MVEAEAVTKSQEERITELEQRVKIHERDLSMFYEAIESLKRKLANAQKGGK
jgi:hypothetical protein